MARTIVREAVRHAAPLAVAVLVALSGRALAQPAELLPADHAAGDPTDAVPSSAEPRWWKGNLHTHTFWSDGNDFPEMVCEWYRLNGWNFLALSDHNVLSRGERWMGIGAIDNRSRGRALDRYLRRFGDGWVETRGSREDGTLEVRLKPFDEYRALVEQRGEFIMLEGEEISDGFDGRPLHLNATNLVELIPPQGGQTMQDAIRNNLMAVQRQAEAEGRAILCHINHPNFGWALTAEDLAHVLESRFFEVFNGHTGVNNLGNRERPGLEELWDIALTIRLSQYGGPMLFGIATDDSHSHHGSGDSTVSVPGRAWVMVRSTHLTPESLIRAMEAGDFYSSTGVVLEDVVFEPESGRLTVAIDPVPGESYTTAFIGTRRGASTVGEPRTDAAGRAIATTLRYDEAIGEVFAEVEGLSPSHVLTGDELYVRAVVTSTAAPQVPSRESLFKKAWTQPVRIGD